MSVSMTRCAGARRRDRARRPSRCTTLRRSASADATASPTTTTWRRSGHAPSSSRSERQPLGRRHQHAHVAVAQDVGDLLRLEQRIDRHEHAAGRGRAERWRRPSRSAFEIDADAMLPRCSPRAVSPLALSRPAAWAVARRTPTSPTGGERAPLGPSGCAETSISSCSRFESIMNLGMGTGQMRIERPS